MVKLLDCTLRDGGYYTDWDFDSKIVDEYILAMNQLPIDYLEVGYRNNPSKEYLGKFAYTPVSVLKHLRELSTKKLAVMLNEKSTKPEDLHMLLDSMKGLADMVRIAIDPKNFDRAVVLAKVIKAMGFEVGFNCMYMSCWLTDYPNFLKKLSQINGVADLFCMVDSFGGMTPKELTTIIKEVMANTTVPIGFHGHNNLQLGLINTLTAIDLGVDYVDCTILGMGRGAGNLNTELLLTVLNAHQGLEVDLNVLGDVITAFTPLYEKYRWGTQLPYMISGANSIPQKEVMELVTNRVYSFNSIVRGLQNRKDKVKDNAKYPILEEKNYENVIIFGGGQSPIEHLDGIIDFIKQTKNIALVFATARHVGKFLNIDAPQYYCLLGREAKRLKANVSSDQFKATCVLHPYPRKLGTDVPEYAEKATYELPKIEFTTEFQDSCTTLAIQTALNICKGNIYIVGYDGYLGSVLSEKEVALTNENMALFQDYANYTGRKMKSLTPSLYPELEVESIYQFI
ncbi:4-hydroxy 2-oxovalerate aldolase [Prevotella sp. ne3005]|uniref:aldolase catalytic domain-containing protein n=1 Tax=Prevotella sp. ne3005 TaxID=1761887 RepID=UPI0008D1DBC8|nr:aldolase catalytic domain-containing protein [Prevotella sp. ne3005]SEM52839.1 4-hydroxy 2-oxovalerate aldolase [Prevotella sp. ne3005]